MQVRADGDGTIRFAVNYSFEFDMLIAVLTNGVWVPIAFDNTWKAYFVTRPDANSNTISFQADHESGITLNSNGVVQIRIPEEEMAVDPGEYSYDVKFVRPDGTDFGAVNKKAIGMESNIR